ncbi:hypothetical protein BASA83_001874 [Batrachochytrium salamandrivorans]|nr:hypothetical protein BASA62_002780 [Batrachochytrium salamandrivorans]KAH9247264.1 hypothetical protein BASA81_015145 [Batrachochytrium salamandrivorans]KAH9275589.1 hypothetical protein BASA83_001874 [Batrachochytrium salamandrivorans]
MANGDQAGTCPVDHSKLQSAARQPLAGTSASTPPPAAGECPVVDHSRDHSQQKNRSLSSELNPLNMMPSLSQDKAIGQVSALPTERTLSGIPRSTSGENWEYPSPQQFFNALKRKGKDAPEEEIPVMVDIHNFLNEACWQEIIKWESKYHCDCRNVKLLKFQGRPDDLSPKAWFYTTFRGVERPFDRHDWTINRCGTDVRYVIDYYSASDEGDNPVFNVDVRPALDSFGSIFDRTRTGISKLWDSIFNS